MRASRVPSTSGVSSTLCSASINSSGVRCPFSRPAASAASKSTCDTPAGSAIVLHRDEHRGVARRNRRQQQPRRRPSPTRRSPAPSQPAHPSFGSRSISHATNRSAAPRTEPGSSSSSSQWRTCAVTAAPACQDSPRPRDAFSTSDKFAPHSLAQEHADHQIHRITEGGVARRAVLPRSPGAGGRPLRAMPTRWHRGDRRVAPTR